MSVARAIIVGALVVAFGMFTTNMLHDLKENAEQRDLRARATACRHWEEKARVVAYEQAGLYRKKLGFDTADQRVQPEYWVALDKVQQSFPESAVNPSGTRVARPADC